MQLIKPDLNINFMKARNLAAVISAAAVAASVFLLFVPGPNYGIDFSGGTEIQFTLDNPVDIGSLRAVVEQGGFSSSDLVRIGGGERTYRIRLQAEVAFEEQEKNKITKTLKTRFKEPGIEDVAFSPGGEKITIDGGGELKPGEIEKLLLDLGLELRERPKADKEKKKKEEDKTAADDDMVRCSDPVCISGRIEDYTYEVYLAGISGTFLTHLEKKLGTKNRLRIDEIEWVGPKVGKQFRNAGVKSILYALGLILIYVAFRFDLRFAPGAVICLAHDVIITAGIFVILQREIVLATIAALLTIVGYSLNDTIVIFDRIRENLAKIRERELRLVVNKSINETMGRTIMTSATTVLSILPILFITRGTIQDFALALTIGIIIGTYSTIYIASPIALWVDKQFYQKKSRR
ncbi:MAG: protein translocase subunit SecF [Pseudomonadota bacterium]